MKCPQWLATWTLTLMIALIGGQASAESEVLEPIDQRFDPDKHLTETPDFQRHIIPLMGKLGCNGRACHGSFQGQGGFRLSLFGYDFQMDHDNLIKGEDPRVDLPSPKMSLILQKPTMVYPHEGGQRMEEGGWEYQVFLKWIQDGAPARKKNSAELVRVEVSPQEILFNKAGETVQLKAIAVWSDGTREDVTPISRFQSNDDQIATINLDGLITANEPGDTHVVVFYDRDVVPVPVLRPVSKLTGKNYPEVATPTEIDRLVVQKLQKLGIVPSETCDDAEFLRRVSLDLTGTLPTAQQVVEFLADNAPHKRSRKIDELLDSEAYAAWWTTRLCDWTGNNEAELNNVVPVRGKASQFWYDWIYKRVADNTSYDDLVEGIVLATGRENDETYDEYAAAMSAIYAPNSKHSYAERETMQYFWTKRNMRQPSEKALGFAYSFMGVRIQCAECHKHPFDQWTQDDYKDFTNFFTGINYRVQPQARDEVEALQKKLGLENLKGNQLRRQLDKKLEKGLVVPFDELYVTAPRPERENRKNNKNNKNKKNQNRNRNTAISARLLGSEMVDLTEYEDPRQPLMDWLRDKDNPYFAKAFVNRVWSCYFNVGLVDPADDQNLANPPSNKAVLDYLAQGFIANNFDMKWLHREILNSRTYQLSWRPNETNMHDERNFSRAVPRRLPAEVAYDALVMATVSDDMAAQMLNEMKDRAISIPSSLNQNNNRGPGYALTIFGRSSRETNCDCDASTEPSLLQTVYLRNDADMLNLINSRNGWINQLSKGSSKKSSAKDLDPREVVEQAYLRTVSRYPTPAEMERSLEYFSSHDDSIEATRGLLWALINTKEFIVNH